VNQALKHVAERMLVGSGFASVARRRLRGRTLVLAYHNVVPEGEVVSGDSSLHLDQCQFARQLDSLALSHEIVPIDELLTDVGSTRTRVAITFDDAYFGALTVGVHELEKRRLPATIFVSPALLASCPWWDILADKTSGGVPHALRIEALESLSGKTDLVLAATNHEAAIANSIFKLPHIGTEADLAHAASKPGISIASHTWSHPNLCKLTEAELEEELRRPLEWARSRFASAVPWLTYPYGLHNERVQLAAEKAGYVGAFRIDGGWIPRSSPRRYSLPRLNIPAGLSLDGFRLRIAGL
jgi:peptidoglycan/xylan/chitin deacetylase (PgdA/CDA1 family)